MTLYCKNRTNHDPVCTNIWDKCIAHTTVLHSKSTQNGQESSRFMRTSWQALKPLTVLLLCSSMQNTILSFVWNATKNNMQHAWSAFPPENSSKLHTTTCFEGWQPCKLEQTDQTPLCDQGRFHSSRANHTSISPLDGLSDLGPIQDDWHRVGANDGRTVSSGSHCANNTEKQLWVNKHNRNQ